MPAPLPPSSSEYLSVVCPIHYTLGGTSDPYVAVSVLDRTRARNANDFSDFRQRCHQTAVVRKTLSPRWTDPSLKGSRSDGDPAADAETASFAWVVGDAAECVITVSVLDEDFNLFKVKSKVLAKVSTMGTLRRIKPLVDRGGESPVRKSSLQLTHAESNVPPDSKWRTWKAKCDVLIGAALHIKRLSTPGRPSPHCAYTEG